MQQTSARGGARGEIVKEGEICFSIPMESRVITVLLGSQPACGATFNYLKGWIELAQEKDFSKIPCYLFVFCAEHLPGHESLLRKVTEHVAQIDSYPSQLTVVPFSFQDDDVIAPLFYRSDLTCTRSGGQTAMELICVSNGENWIHSEAKKNRAESGEIAMEGLLKGIPGWEAANALYLQKFRGAKIVTPETFLENARQFFCINERIDRPMRAFA